MSTTIKYNNETIATATNQSKLLKTAGTYMEGDVLITDSSPTYNTQAKSNINPSTSSQTITPDSGYDALSSVQINAMPTGTAGTPTATKGTVSNHSISVTPSVTNTTGYITGSTKTGTAVTVSASELVSGTKSITDNGTGIDVTDYAFVDVAVSSDPDVPIYSIHWGNGDTPDLIECSKGFYQINGDYAIIREYEDGVLVSEVATSMLSIRSSYIKVYYGVKALNTGLPRGELIHYPNEVIDYVYPPDSLTSLNVTANGTYNASYGTAYTSVNVNVPTGGGGTDIPVFTLLWENDYPWDGDTSYIHSFTCNKNFSECYSLVTQELVPLGILIENTLDGENYGICGLYCGTTYLNRLIYTATGGDSHPYYDITFTNNDSKTLTIPSASAKTLNATANGTYYPSGGVFTKAIVNVPTGGGGPVPKKQINFIDYDGTIVNSYTKTEWQGVSSLPSNPSHTGLTAQGWNWTKAQIDAQLTAAPDGDIWVGQMYITTSGDTEIDVCFADATRLNPILTIAVNGTITVDWGDNTTPNTVTGTSLETRQAVSHTYAAAGDYMMTIHVVSGSFQFYGSSSYLLLRKNTAPNENKVYANCVRAVRFGSNVTSIGNSAFNSCFSLASITIPSSVTSIGTSAFNSCYFLASITIPSGITTIGTNAFSGCYGMASITIPSSVTSIGNSAFYYCYSLASITIPSGITTIGNSAFYYCYSLASITIPSSVTSIGANAFYYCFSLASITIPSSVTSIGTSAFSGCYGMAEYHILPTTPPAFGTGVFDYIVSDCKIYVPSASLSTYQGATNWSTYASYMVGE